MKPEPKSAGEAPDDTPKQTPLMRRYVEILATLPPDALLMFRLGDFWELFGECAVVASKVLRITLTSRGGIPMAGVPYHSLDRYVAQLVEAGYLVATAEIADGVPSINQHVKKQIQPDYR